MVRRFFISFSKKFGIPIPHIHLIRREGKIAVRYIIAGSFSAASQFFLFLLLLRILGEDWYLSASIIAFCFALGISFTLQKFWTFRDASRHRVKKQFSLYGFVALINLVANAVSMHLLVSVFYFDEVFAQLITMGLIAVWSFVTHRLFTFNHRGLYVALKKEK